MMSDLNDTVEVLAQDVIEAFDDDELPIEDFEEVTVEVDREDMIGKVAVRDKLLAQIEGRAEWHRAEATTAELRGDESRARDERDSYSDLRSYARKLRRHVPKPPPTPWDRDTAKVIAVTEEERRFFGLRR